MPTMMGSFTRCWQKLSLLLLTLVWLGLGALPVQAGTIEAVQSQLNLGDDGYALSAQFEIDLGPRLEEALTRGVTLNFNLEFSIERLRWYWLNERIVGRVVEYRLAYNALTQQYRLSVGNLHSSFSTLREALRVLGHVSDLVVAGKNTIKPGYSYLAELRMVLDKSQLPKPFQLDAVANKDWQVDSPTMSWQFAPGVVGR